MCAGVLLALGALVAPVAIVASWTATQTASTDAFVDTFAPLLETPEVRAVISAEVSSAVVEAADIPGLTAQAFEGVESLGLPPRATSALGALQGAAVEGITGLIERTVDDVINSPGYDRLITAVLKNSHREIVAALSGSENSLLALGPDGSLGVRLGPIIDSVRERLVDRGLSFASAIPSVDRTIVLVQADELAKLKPAYAALQAVGAWLAPVAALLLVAGVLLAPRRRVAMLWAAGALAGILLLVVLALRIGVGTIVPGLGESLGSEPAAREILATLTEYIRTISVTVAILAIVTGIVTWVTGPWSPPRRFRAACARGFARLRPKPREGASIS
ncbi:hypothetical protein D9V32_10230 [Mycetocola tolaasinivorans]|uniref:DUF2207 domain-containing protein n=1 Tax=Mycetocola tolaasinivorans TaxID=76635 RepID=A0A3L7A4J2_9MICO|nr:hypothetical protein D9V32_10230 [Mycetocola tolaasinivorans]